MAEDPATKVVKIGPGDVHVKADVTAPDSLVFAPNTTVHVDVPRVFISAPQITWGDNVVFVAEGADGADGRNVPDSDRVYWCMAQDHNNWEEEWDRAVPPAGKRGGDGAPGEAGRDIEISARQHAFASAKAQITFRCGGGHGGRAGKGGLGGSYSLKPSGADCDHGTNEKAHKDGPPGPDGTPGPNGPGGHIVFRSRKPVALKRANVEGGTLIWLVPGTNAEVLGRDHRDDFASEGE